MADIDYSPEQEAAHEAELARLRAAKAELLAALKDIMANSVGNPKSCGHEWHCVCAWDAARAAIRKAEGE